MKIDKYVKKLGITATIFAYSTPDSLKDILYRMETFKIK